MISAPPMTCTAFSPAAARTFGRIRDAAHEAEPVPRRLFLGAVRDDEERNRPMIAEAIPKAHHRVVEGPSYDIDVQVNLHQSSRNSSAGPDG